jgi:hypothetical protein
METEMVAACHLSTNRAGLFAAAMCLAILGSSSTQVAAQAGAEPAATLAAKVDSSDLPDAPMPVVASGPASDQGDPLIISTSFQPPTQTPPPNTGPSLGDLGLTPADTEGSVARQAILDRRTHMLKVHQRLGLITVIPVAAACITAAGAPPKRGDYSNTADRDLHVALGATSVAMYALTASYAIRAPKVSNEHARGCVKWHKYLIYIHAPGMILTPILGAMAFNQINSGQKVHGIASAHGPVAIVTAGSYGAAIIAVSWPIHIKF